MKNISFMLTTAQIRARTKDVTRRMGWADLTPGTLLCAVEKGQGIKKGENINRLNVISIVHVRREPLNWMTAGDSYGALECIREGFPKMTPVEFVEMFCASHKDCTPQTEITRIEFSYEFLTHFAKHADPQWLAIHRPSALELLKGYPLNEAEKNDPALMMMGYCNLLERAGLVHYGATEAEAIAAAGNVSAQPRRTGDSK